MSVEILTLANLGTKQNLSTPDILPVITKMAEEGCLQKILCQVHQDFSIVPTESAVPKILRYTVRLPGKLLGMSIPRRWEENMFDFFASRKVGKSEVLIFHGGYFFPRTLRKAHGQGSVAIEITRTAHPEANARLEREEHEVLGLSRKETQNFWQRETFPHLKKFNYVIALSDFVKKSYEDIGYPREKLFVATPDIDLRRFCPGKATPGKRMRFLYAGFTTPLKGLHYLLDAWESLDLFDAELVIAGGYGHMPRKLKAMYDARIRKAGNILWIGSTRTPEAEYQKADAFVFPSLTEGFGRVTLEAMACGIPVITTENARGIVEDGKTGFVVPIRNAHALAEKIRYFYENRDVAREMGKEARRAVENKKPFGEAVYEIYQEICRMEGIA
jgi:glycosyltransferase involved in cell wall biosynthesis